MSHEVWKDETGGARVALLGILLILLLFWIGVVVIEYSFGLARRETIVNDVHFSALATYRELNLVELARGRKVINTDKAEETFKRYLCQNLRLDSSLNPIEGSLVGGQVTIVEFEVYNPQHLPVTCSEGTTLTETSAHVIVTVPLKTIYKIGDGKLVELRIHFDTDAVEEGY